MMIMICPLLFVGWKLVRKTRFHRPLEVDLRQDLAGIEEYQRDYVPSPPKSVLLRDPLGLVEPHCSPGSHRNSFEKLLDGLFG